MDAATIGIICTVIGALIGVFGYKRAFTKDIQAETKEGAIMATKLDFISQGVNNIQIKMEMQENKFGVLSERITRVEESVKSVHKRLNEEKGEM